MQFKQINLNTPKMLQTVDTSLKNIVKYYLNI